MEIPNASPESSDVPNSPKKGLRFKRIFAMGVVTFILGVLGNLVAAWLQENVLSNAFTPLRVFVILLVTLTGVLLTAVLDYHSQEIPTPSDSTASGLDVAQTSFVFSKTKIRGRRIRLRDFLSFGSHTDIDTHD
jgi:uncharacterized membrane protein YfcA